MKWTSAGRRLVAGDGGGSGHSSRAATHHHTHHHIHHRGLLSSGGALCPGLWRKQHAAMLVATLVALLLLNMLLLGPHLHAQAPHAGASSSSGGWYLTGWSPAGQQPGAAATAAASPAGAAQQQQQQRGGAADDFMQAFDVDSSGTLDPHEFDALAQEACRNDRTSLGLVSWVSRLIRLAFGLRPRYIVAGSEPYPCSLRGELADATNQAAAALNRGFRGSRGTGSGGSSKRGWSGKGAGRGADSAAGAATVDPDSPEGRAAAQRASLLARCSPLSPDLAAAAAPGGTLLLVAADWGMFELFGINWLTHVQRSGLDNYLLAALDQKTADFLSKHKLGRCISWNPLVAGGGSGMLPEYTPPAASPGSRQHATLSWVSLQVASTLLSWEYDVILSHLDTVWLTDPQPYLAAHVPPAADVVLGSEAPAAAATLASESAGLLPHPQPSLARVTTGAVFIRGSRQGAAAVGAWLDAHAAQVAAASATAAQAGAAANTSTVLLPDDIIAAWLGGVTGRGRGGRTVSLSVTPHATHPSSLLAVGPAPGLVGSLLWPSSASSSSRAVGVGIFSPVAVSNSYSWFVQGVGWRAAAVIARSGSSAASGRKLPLAVHVGGGHDSREGRLHLMREAQWYADGPRYYSDPKLLSFELTPYASPEVSAGLANAPDFNQGAQLALHLASLAHQLQQFYAGAALAAALGRVLVLPNFQCYCFRDAGSLLRDSDSDGASSRGWSCRAPGDDNSAFPFNCTLDQVLDPGVLYSHKLLFGGKPLVFRESTFLHNPRSPSWIRHASTTIRSGTPASCPDETAPCAQVLPGKPPKGVNQQVVVPASLTDAALAEVLAQFSAAKWLHFLDVTSVFGGFANPAHKAEYEAWLDMAVLPWCCKPSGDDGSDSGSTFGSRGDASAQVVGVGEGEAAGGSSPLEGIVEVPTVVPGMVAVEVKARPAERTATA